MAKIYGFKASDGEPKGVAVNDDGELIVNADSFGETDAPASITEPETTEARSMISLLKAIKNQNISGDAVMQSKVDDMTALLEIIAEELDTV